MTPLLPKTFLIKTPATLAAISTALLAGAVAGCSKYDDGPAFSLRPPTQRLAREWKLTSTDSPDAPDDLYYTLEFQKDGDVKFEYRFTRIIPGGGILSSTAAGKVDWEWVDQKETLEIDYNTPMEFHVLKLTTKNLVWEDKDDHKWFFEAR